MTIKQKANLEALRDAGKPVAPGELPYPKIVAAMILEGWVDRNLASPVVVVSITQAGLDALEAAG